MSYHAYARIRQHTLADVLREHRRSRHAMAATVDGTQRLTYKELDQRVNRLATAMTAKGIVPGDHILWFGQNSAKIFEVLLAAAKLGAVLCPANWRMTATEVTWTIADFAPKIVFWQEEEVGERQRASRAECATDCLWIQHDGTGLDGYEALLALGEDRDDEIAGDGDAPLLAIYTAGFSGRPNAALLPSNAILLQAMLGAWSQAIDETSRYLMSGPMFHIGVLMGGFATFVSGGCAIFIPRTEAGELLRLIADERPSHGFVPAPTLLKMQSLNAELRLDVSSLFAKPDMSDYQAALVMPVAAPWRQRPGGYGQTEVMGLSVFTCLGGDAAGRPAPFAAVRIIDEKGDDVPEGEVGEIAMRGPMTMCGYHRRDEENGYRTAAGWHRTRDLGRRLPNGSIVFVGPKSVLIKTGIENVYPAEVEACLKRHAAIADVCIIGVPDPQWDQNIKAVVVPAKGSTPTLQDIVTHCREHLSSYKKPKLLALVDSLPRTADGAIDRAAVDAAHGGGGYPRVG